MMNDLVGQASARPRQVPRGTSALKSGFNRLMVGLGFKRPSFADKVEEYRRGNPAEQRARQQALRCVDGIEEARSRLLSLARGMSEGGIETTVKFWPIAYRVGIDVRERKYGFAEMQAAILLTARTPAGREVTPLPITITATRREIMILPNFALLQASEPRNHVTDLFLKVANSLKSGDGRGFCERLEDTLAQAVANGRLQG